MDRRYDTLSATRAELAARQDRDLHALGEARRALLQLTEDKSKALMGLNNNLAELWVRYDQTRMRDFQWETSLSHMRVKAAEKSREVGAVSPPRAVLDAHYDVDRVCMLCVFLPPGAHDELEPVPAAMLLPRRGAISAARPD